MKCFVDQYTDAFLNDVLSPSFKKVMRSSSRPTAAQDQADAILLARTSKPLQVRGLVVPLSALTRSSNLLSKVGGAPHPEDHVAKEDRAQSRILFPLSSPSGESNRHMQHVYDAGSSITIRGRALGRCWSRSPIPSKRTTPAPLTFIF